MNLTELLKFLPLLLGGFLAYHLIFKQNLPTKNVGQILTYFVGIIIVFVAISWLITTFLAGWATDMLQAGTASTDWQQFINQSETVVEDAFAIEGSGGATTVRVDQNSPVIMVVTPTPASGTSGGTRAITAGGTYTVVAGDTLFSIAQRNGTTIEAIKAQNGLATDTIYPGQQLVIPASK